MLSKRFTRSLLATSLAMSCCISAWAVPAVSLISPYFTPDQGWTVSGSISFSINASDAQGVSKVEFYVDDKLASTDSSYPYSWLWDTTKTSIGAHTLKAIAFNSQGQSSGVQQSVIVAVSDTAQTADSTTKLTAAQSLAASIASTVTLEENDTGFCGVDGTIDNNHTGFTGTGFANTNNGIDQGVNWRFNAGTAGTYTLGFHYAGVEARAAQLLVDDNPAVAVNFPSTGAWTSWGDLSVSINLTAGAHDIRIASTTADGLSNIDSLTLSGASIQALACNASTSSASVSGNVQMCNWYGSYYPLCTTTPDGWGWENEQSCIARTTCSGQPAPYGIVNTSSSAQTSSSSKTSSSKSSVATTSSSKSSSSSGQTSSSQTSAKPDPTGPLTGSIGTHDPSRIIESNGKYYSYSTGSNIPMKYSTDKLKWTSGPSVFPNGLPSWTRTAVPDNDGHDVWAPDIFYMNGLYHLYYSVSSWGGKQSAIGLVTSPTLDPSAANYKWTDRGAVITTGTSVTYTAIDPAPVLDENGNPWLVFGSGYTVSWSTPTVMLIQLDKATGKRISANSTVYSLAPGHVEASYIHYHNGYYYLFYNDGGCCSGTSSTYKIHVLRSKTITGPYVDKNGATNGSSNLFMQSSNGLYGPGHIGILSKNGNDYFSYHYYNASGQPVLGEGRLIWGSNGWPTPGN